MKKYFPVSLFLSFSILIFISYSCSENNVIERENVGITFTSQQITGCNNFGLSKVNFDDSCFTYSFNDTLKIDFCVFGNCCPDSQRFDANYNIKSDTIFVAVSDTSENLCRCICNYKIQIALSGLAKDEYLFVCDYPSDTKNLKYRELMQK